MSLQTVPSPHVHQRIVPTADVPIRAVGHHVLVLRPLRLDKTAGGIVLPAAVQQAVFYGRVISVGGKVDEIAVGDIVVCQRSGADVIEFESLAADKRVTSENLLCVVEDMVEAILTEEEARKRGLRIDDISTDEPPAVHPA